MLSEKLLAWSAAQATIESQKVSDEDLDEANQIMLDVRYEVIKEVFETEEGCTCLEAFVLEQIAKKLRCK